MKHECSIADLESTLAGTLPPDDEAALYRHLESCAECSAALEQLAGGRDWCDEAATMLHGAELDADVPTGDEWSAADFCVEHLEPSDEPNVLGRLGSYDVLEVIGQGGMGVVLKGFDRELRRCVAIKVLAPHLAASSLAKQRFTREAQAAASIVHPNVLAIHQVQPGGRVPFLVMPLLAGESLAQRLAKQGRLELKEVLRIGMQAAAGLAAAHEQGLVHRDVKPANILLEKGVERAVLTDFGLARAADDVTLTRWGIIAGTPQYMSPEQARGEPLDGRSDLFSLGCVLYEMATGVSPFRSDSVVATLRRLVDDSPRAMSALNPELPPWFIRIVDRLLEKDPAERFESAQEVSELLEGCLAHVQQPAAVPLPAAIGTAPRRRVFTRSRIWKTSAMIAALGLGMFAVLLATATPPDIAGEWQGEDWGDVVLSSTGDGEYVGTFTDTPSGRPGAIELEWSRIERRFNGTWSEGTERFGEISLRLVGDEIRGARTTDPESREEETRPRLADFSWQRRSDDEAEETSDHAEVGSDAAALTPQQEREIEAINLVIPSVDPWPIVGEHRAKRVSFYPYLDLAAVLHMTYIPRNATDYFPDWLMELNGERVRIRGYMYTTLDGVEGFLLCRDLGPASFGPNPRADHRIPVTLQEGETTDYIHQTPIDVEGTFHVQLAIDDLGKVSHVYAITDATIFHLSTSSAEEEMPLPEALLVTREHIARIEELIADAPVTTNYLAEIFEQTPGVEGEYRIREDVVVIPIRRAEISLLDDVPLGAVYYLPASKGFYIQWDDIAASTLHYYGPFYGVELDTLGLIPISDENQDEPGAEGATDDAHEVTDLERLQGRWESWDDEDRVIYLMIDGMEFTEFIHRPEDQVEMQGSISLDESTDPRQMIVTFSSITVADSSSPWREVPLPPDQIPQQYYAIYRIDAQGLTRRIASDRFPTEFDDSDQWQTVFVRHEQPEHPNFRRRDQNDADEISSDLARLQGTWASANEPTDDVPGRRLIIEGSEFTDIQTYPDAPEITHTGHIEILPTNPRRLLMTIDSASSADGGRVPGRIPREVPAIYKWDDQGLTIRMGSDEFPTEFDASDPRQIVFVKQHEIRGDLALLQGTWESEPSDAGRVIHLRIDGLAFTQRIEQPGQLGVVWHGNILLDESTDPRQMEMAIASITISELNTERAAQFPPDLTPPPSYAIYRLDEDELTIRMSSNILFPREFDDSDPLQSVFHRLEISGDLERLQGTWESSYEPTDDVPARRLIIQGTSFTEIQTYPNFPEVTHTGHIELNESTDPPQMLMWISSASSSIDGYRIPGRVPREVPAIYRLDDQGLTIRMGSDEFPSEFDDTDPRQIVFNRVGQAGDPMSAIEPIGDITREDIIGTWSGNDNGLAQVFFVLELSEDGSFTLERRDLAPEFEETTRGLWELDADAGRLILRQESDTAPGGLEFTDTMSITREEGELVLVHEVQGRYVRHEAESE